jgi:two-component system OmpR family response regulator
MRILVAEDDTQTARMIADVLREDGYDVVIAASGDVATRELIEGAFDIAVLDRMLPVRNGMSVLRAAREAGVGTHFLIVTALGSIANRVEGLEAGADDYLTKPFALTELVARIHALERRLSRDDATQAIVRGRLVLNVHRRELRIDGRLVALQPRELRLLEEVMRGAGQTLTRAMLLQNVWGFSFEPQTNLVETHMSRLRSKLAIAGAKDVIRTVRGAGYALAVGD